MSFLFASQASRILLEQVSRLAPISFSPVAYVSLRVLLLSRTEPVTRRLLTYL